MSGNFTDAGDMDATYFDQVTDPIPDEAGITPEPPEDDPEASEVDIPDMED